MSRDQIKNLAEVVSPYFSGEIKCDFRALEKRREILSNYGSIDAFIKNSKFELITDAEDSNLEKFYTLYASIFTNPAESEALDGFKKALSLRTDSQFKNKFGNFGYSIIIASDPDSGDIMGGVSFSNYVMPKNISQKFGISGTNQIAYIFVDPVYRKALVGQELYKKMESFSQNYISVQDDKLAFEMTLKGNVIPNNMYFFAEFEAPELVSADLGQNWFLNQPELAVEQMKRLAWWDKMGFRRIQMSYIQPSLREGENACTILSLNVKDHGESSIHKKILNEHIDRFFSIDVLKGRLLEHDESYLRQLDAINVYNSEIPVVEIRKHYQAIQDFTPVKIFN